MNISAAMQVWLTRLGWALLGLIVGVGITIAGIAFGWFDRFMPIEPIESYGSFSGNPKVELLEDGRFFKLVKDFSYTDPRGKTWLVKRNFPYLNGASIPQAFWSIVGGPLEGKYRNASIVHDMGCYEKKETSDDVHRMFYEACLCGGVTEEKAKILFAAVYLFGPTWKIEVLKETIQLDGKDGRSYAFTVEVPVSKELVKGPEPSEAKAKVLVEYIKANNPSLEEIRKLDTSKLAE